MYSVDASDVLTLLFQEPYNQQSFQGQAAQHTCIQTPDIHFPPHSRATHPRPLATFVLRPDPPHLPSPHLDPVIGDAQAVPEGDAGCPAQLLADELVVRVAAAHALRPRDVADGGALAIEPQHHLHHAIHADHLVAPQIQRAREVRLGDAQDALHAVVDESEGPGLQAVAPHLQLVLGRQHLGGK
ncbi:hypothetical protein F751_1085 [Auxenochlorella protothecoides]|uniref:Uncharacterized protein n=1 Tax=Auxenochlorella protothecoides TaxID=3075 RepID=A0A087SCD5_AUXPR|nr:hypothetical protein F751_1085 [Auxenochlorella protothecoides]KFM23389.1 hypothetical protein F751_1085 [Auxenochlorella protothecoides]